MIVKKHKVFLIFFYLTWFILIQFSESEFKKAYTDRVLNRCDDEDDNSKDFMIASLSNLKRFSLTYFIFSRVFFFAFFWTTLYKKIQKPGIFNRFWIVNEMTKKSTKKMHSKQLNIKTFEGHPV